MTDSERLDAIIAEIRKCLGGGWWWHAMHDIHMGCQPREAIDKAMGPRLVAGSSGEESTRVDLISSSAPPFPEFPKGDLKP